MVFPFLLILCIGVVSATPASTSDDILHGGLKPLAANAAIPNTDSRVPSVNSFSLNDTRFVAGQLFRRFGIKDRECFIVALQIEDAPPGFVEAVVEELLQLTKSHESRRQRWVPFVYILAHAVGHCDLAIDIRHRFKWLSVLRIGALDNVAELASLPLEKLLKKHALPERTFLQVLEAKYHDSGYGSFFKDPAWYTQYHSNTVLSHALHLYNKLNGTIDFEPIPFGHIASTQTMSEQTRMTLHDMYSPSNSISVDRRDFTFSLLQSVLSPGSEMEFFTASSPELRTDFLMLACETGRLEWVKFMTGHHLWNDVEMSYEQLSFLAKGWHLSSGDTRLPEQPFRPRVMRYADVRAVVDPALAAFEMVFHHQMNRLPSRQSRELCEALLETSHEFTEKLFIDYLSNTNSSMNS